MLIVLTQKDPGLEYELYVKHNNQFIKCYKIILIFLTLGGSKEDIENNFLASNNIERKMSHTFAGLFEGIKREENNVLYGLICR